MPLLTWSQDYDLRMNEGITRRDAALAVVRLVESEDNLLDDNNYNTVEGENGGQNMIIELLYAQDLAVEYDNYGAADCGGCFQRHFPCGSR